MNLSQKVAEKKEFLTHSMKPATVSYPNKIMILQEKKKSAGQYASTESIKKFTTKLANRIQHE